MNTTAIVINELKNQFYYIISWIYILILWLNFDSDYYYYIVYNEYNFNILYVTILIWAIHYVTSFIYNNNKSKIILLIFILILYFLLLEWVPSVNTEVKSYYNIFYYIMISLNILNISYLFFRIKND